MTALPLRRAESGVVALLSDLIDDIASRYDSGGYTTTGRLKASLTASFTRGAVATSGVLYGAQYYRYVANGRPPGKRPPAGPLADWALAKGIAESVEQARSIGFAIANKIAAEGSFGFRAGRANVADEAIDAAMPAVDRLLVEILEQDVNASMVSIFRNTLSRV